MAPTPPAPDAVFASAATLALAFLLPLAGLVVSWRAALRPLAHGHPPRLFGAAHRGAWIVLAAFCGWMQAVHASPALLIATLGPPRPEAWVPFALAWLGPPALLASVHGLMAHDLARRAGLSDWTAREAVEDALWMLLGALASVTFVAGGAALFVNGRLREAALAAAAAIGIAASVGGRRRRAGGLTPYAITSGELRDRLFALAARAGVALKQLHVVPLRRFRLANAFAVQGHGVLLTDVLLERLGRDEVDAVLAHEMAHLKRRDPDRYAWTLLGPVALAIVAGQFLGAAGFGAGLLAGLLGMLAILRRIEHATDAAAIALGAKPEAMITGLARLGQLSHVPARWSRLVELFLTHPSTERRAHRIAAGAGIPRERADRWLADVPPAGETYGIPDAVHAPRVFGSAFRQAVVARISWGTLLVLGLGPAFVVAAAAAAGMPRLAAIGAAALIASLAGQGVWWLAGVRGVARLRAPLADRLRDAAPWAREDGAEYVGFAPDATPRLYEGFIEWDAGFVRLAGDRLDYAGEEARFSLSPVEVRQIRLDHGWPGWMRVRAVRIHWERADGSGGTFGLVALGASNPLEVRRAAHRLLDRIVRWRDDPAFGRGDAGDPQGAATPGFDPPRPIAVTSASPRDAAAPRAVAGAATLLAIASVLAAALAGLPFHPFAAGWPDALLATLGAHALTVAPFLGWREPRAEAAPPAAGQRRAA